MQQFTDQLNRTIQLQQAPKRIISLVPSQTELLYHLGLEEEVIGITKFCIHPQEWFRNKERIGGTKNVHIKKVMDLQPDLIIANKEENVQEQVEELATLFPVWVSDVNNLSEAIKMIKGIGCITNKEKDANKISKTIQSLFSEIQPSNNNYKTAYLIWKDPYMTVGGDTFIHDMLNKTGFQNIFADHLRYPSITIEDLQKSKPELLLLSSEPYPFKQKHMNELQTLLQATKIILVDGEMFSWYGSRLLKAPAYFNNLHQQIKSIV